ncbi:sulfotransferase domain-containing protein [Fulvivirga sp. 29W222]|uniref:Sulfotransferase domain-containing protein n=1 Tax=Fulvivirga marina TaxID=2494733 RepID=A0A937KCA4_9BACT|nr:sulfotransferase [Fulvivirga marina]MBL6444755.1 sulfotransferase domain-containing protein [Fulvivirga marina]
MEKVRKIVKHVIGTIGPTVKPSFLIVGGQKCGTTALHYYLNQHPLLLGSRPKEVNFFSNEKLYKKGLGWYKKAFINMRNPFGSIQSFEATPEYLYYTDAARRIFDFNPRMKIIILLREPIQRAYSAWNMYKYFGERKQGLPKQFYDGQENNIFHELYSHRDSFPTFEEAVYADIMKWNKLSSLQEPSFVRRGIYYPQVKRFYEMFGKENVKIIGFKDLTGANRRSTLNSILEFLNLETSTWNFLNDNKRNSRKYESPMQDVTKKSLEEFFDSYNQQLFQLINFKPNW